MPPRALKPGDRIGHYKVEGRLGEGAMGEVWRALDTRLHRRVALKLLRGAQGGGDASAQMLREARAAAALNHPNTVAIYEIGEHEGAPYLAMELVSGRLLRTYVKEPLPLATKLDWMSATARVLGAAHRAGLVHRDIKPENVMITDAGAVKVLDFGIARRTRPSDAGLSASVDVSFTRDGTVVGTPAYMAPEQIRGDALDGRTDQFAWGVVAFELLTGELPWKHPHDSLAVLGDIISAAPRPLDGVAADVASVILRALEKSTAARFQSMEDAADALEASSVGSEPDLPFELRSTQLPSAPRAQPAITSGASQGRIARRRIVLASILAALAAVVVGAVWWSLGQR